MPLAIGDKLGPYEIVSLIGQGGMGAVYRARDPRLGRDVAIKLLHEKHSDRLEREARAVAALNHPHICAIHDIGPNYLVMEYVEGAQLKGPLPQAEAIRLAVQIAQALAAAHAKGITHRDLKPANILVTASGVKLLDFGLAKLTVPEDSDSTRTIAGTVLGTAAYMSPEQAQGQPADARSDIFSFGAVLYEMLSGRRAFSSNTSVSTMAAILHKEPEPLDAAPALQSIVSRCLKKTPADRFESAAELGLALEKASAMPGDKVPSIAVLPFADMSADKDHEWFSDGLAEEIINLLAHIPGLKVIARTSAFAFKGKNEDVRKIAETLGVSSVLEGSVRRAGSRLRITAQLIHAADGTHLWSERFDREMTDVFAIQDEIAEAITAALKVTLAVASKRERYQPKLAAYEAYMKARHHWGKVTPESLARCREYYEQAIALDPQFALAYVGLGEYFMLMCFGAALVPAHEAMPKTRALAQEALRIDPSLPEAQAMLGAMAGLYDFDWKEAEQFFRSAMASDPVKPWARVYYAYFYLKPTGRLERAIEELEQALGEDPLNLMSSLLFAVCLHYSRRFEDASAECYRILGLDDGYWWAYWLLATAFVARGMLTEALPMAEKAYSLAPWNVNAISILAAVLQLTGKNNRAEELLHSFRSAPIAYAAPRGLMYFYLDCGEIDLAADWAEKSLLERDPQTVVAAFDYFRSSPRWPALAKMMNLPETP